MVRYRLVFKGTVQGVGFRYFVYRIAAKSNLTGYVRNLDDGSVEAEVQGQEADFAEFLAAVRRGNGLARIRSYTASDMPVFPDERQFEIY